MRIGPTPKQLRVRFALRPGDSVIRLTTTAARVQAPPGDERELYVRFDSPVVSDAAFAPLAKPLAPT
jgi:hypothetical protein